MMLNSSVAFPGGIWVSSTLDEDVRVESFVIPASLFGRRMRAEGVQAPLGQQPMASIRVSIAFGVCRQQKLSNPRAELPVLFCKLLLLVGSCGSIFIPAGHYEPQERVLLPMNAGVSKN